MYLKFLVSISCKMYDAQEKPPHPPPYVIRWGSEPIVSRGQGSCTYT